jgi:hypothetical protein
MPVVRAVPRWLAAAAPAALAAAALALSAPAAVLADELDVPCALAPQRQWLSIDELKARARRAGYIWIGNAEIEQDACIEINAYNPRTGARVSLMYDPSSGRLVAVR